jgi:hypothetical protein
LQCRLKFSEGTGKAGSDPGSMWMSEVDCESGAFGVTEGGKNERKSKYETAHSS